MSSSEPPFSALRSAGRAALGRRPITGGGSLPGAGLTSLAIHAVLLPAWLMGSTPVTHRPPHAGATASVLSVRLQEPTRVGPRSSVPVVGRLATVLEPVPEPPEPVPSELPAWEAQVAAALDPLPPQAPLRQAWFDPGPRSTRSLADVLPLTRSAVTAPAAVPPGPPRSAALAVPSAAPPAAVAVEAPADAPVAAAVERPVGPARAAPAESPAEPATVPSPEGAATVAEPLGENPAPRYPGLARRKGWQGTVVLAVQVDATGAASGVSVSRSSGRRMLDDAARQAVAAWRFLPARRAGVAVASHTEVVVAFELEG